MKKSLHINRELSWLEFNQRVLHLALSKDVPLLERVKFLAITGSNLDEFFMVRVGGLQMLETEENRSRDTSGMTVSEQLDAIGRRAHTMVADQYAVFRERLEPALGKVGIRRVPPESMTEPQAAFVANLFKNDIFPLLTPIDLSAERDFPALTHASFHLGVRLKPAAGAGRPRFAIVPVGRGMPRFISLPAERGYPYLLIEDAIALHIHLLFPGESIAECVPFRITRNADMSVREDLAGDLISQMQAVLEARKRSDCVRLEAHRRMSHAFLAFLQKTFDIDSRHTYLIEDPIDVSSLMNLTRIGGYAALRDPPWPAQPSPDAPLGESLFKVLSRGSLLLNHPYDSFEPVIRLVNEAADDPDVLAIKQILYRTSRNSPIVAALKRAAERGKYVTALVELKARFDEARNIEWARELEDAGVQVIYGVKNLKTHAKLCLVIRREPQGLQRYIHVGTGNYNEITAQLYSDISYMTADPDLGADATAFFNAITACSQPQRYRRLAAAPLNLRDRLLELIDGERERRRQGQKTRIMIKINSLADSRLIAALYAASQAGVQIDLNIRGICCLRPGVPRLSENISVVSIVGRFLEHSRVLYFRHGGEEEVFISSADWLPRNLDRRVELLTPIQEPALKRRLIDTLEMCFQDNTDAFRLLPNGHYEPLRAAGSRRLFRSQELLYRQARDRTRQERHARRSVFKPHRPPAATDPATAPGKP